MSKRINRERYLTKQKYKTKDKFTLYLVDDEIIPQTKYVITKHALSRHRERSFQNQEVSDEVVRLDLIKKLNKSTVINIHGCETHHEYRNMIFVTREINQKTLVMTELFKDRNKAI